MNTSRSDEQPSVTRTLGERMVMVARMLGAEHVRQELDEAGVDLAQVQRELRERVVRQDLFEPLSTRPARATGGASNPFADAAPIALPQRVKAQRKPPSRTIAEIDAELDARAAVEARLAADARGASRRRPGKREAA